ncbi:MAG: hypothetical protein HC924_10855 [Synechococcaceae cyanobacterium SM2_3_2]|nr:hypothetical protein [Synechococcaceae cyanobacterium SM2_3_2]
MGYVDILSETVVSAVTMMDPSLIQIEVEASLLERAVQVENTLIEDYELAAGFYNISRRQGIQGSNTDFLI